MVSSCYSMGQLYGYSLSHFPVWNMQIDSKLYAIHRLMAYTSISVCKPFPWDSIWPIHPFRIWFFNGRHTKCFHAIYAYLRSRMPLIEPNAIKHFKICAATLTFDGHPSTSIWLHRIVLLDELWVKCRMRSFNSLCHWGALIGNKNSSGKSHRF